MERRQFLAGAAGLVGGALIPRFAFAKVPTPFTFDMSPPMDSREKFIEWGVAQRGEDPKFLGERFDRFGAMVRNEDIWDERHKRAFLLTPREKFVLPQNLGRAYEHAFLDIGYGVTISGPHIVGRMTSTIDPKQGEKVLEIGTGSGYQSAYLSHLTDQVYTIEIIKPLAERTRGIYDSLIADGYVEFKAIQSRNADGYYGWVEAPPPRRRRGQSRRDARRRGFADAGRERDARRRGEPDPRRDARSGGDARADHVRQDHRHLRHRPRSAAAAAATQAERDHGHSGRSARRPAGAEGRQEPGGRRLDHRRALRHLRRPHRALRPLHQARRRRHQGHAQQLIGAPCGVSPPR